MKALPIHLDGNLLGTAGLPGFGVVTCILAVARREAAHTPDGQDEPDWTCGFQVGGRHGPEPGLQEYLDWHDLSLEGGQEVTVRGGRSTRWTRLRSAVARPITIASA